MCYDVSFKAKASDLLKDFSGSYMHEPESDFGPADHIQGVAVFPKYPIVFSPRDQPPFQIRKMEWGVIAYWEKEEPPFTRRNGMLNARAERILDDEKSYWHKIRNRRCLIPVTGIFEHRRVERIKNKVPYHVKPKDQDIFYLPGLYSVAKLLDKATGELMERFTYTLITRAANDMMAMIHNDGDNAGRMPLFLPKSCSDDWLKDELPDEEYRAILKYKMPSEELETRTVYTIRSAKGRPDGKDKTGEWDWGIPNN